MALASGTRLGVYEIIGLLGVGGMGEVYRARDTRLGRDVAIKVLPASVAVDPDRLARFEREARLLATLNHPHIGAIYGVEESAGLVALVLELVDGETLAARLQPLATRGLSCAEALKIAAQIADALDAAHERGIVHRDLKPANIVITAEGTVKVLDFGLAKGSAAPDRSGDLTHSPTVIGPTLDGVLLGTAPYMSPEQARGKPVDKRTDIWAFGCVLYEMLTGRRAFAGETSSDVIAAILEREPDWRALPPSTPPHVVRTLKRCLEKDPRRRVRDIADARIDLDWHDALPGPMAKPATSSSRLWIAALASALIASLGALAWVWVSRPAPVRQPIQFTFGAPDDEQFESDRPVPSPDGSSIAFVARSTDRQRSVWIRDVGTTVLRRLGDTDGAVGAPFWSPDGAWIGFVAEGKLRKVRAAGGPAVTICASSGNLGATWNRDNVIVLAPTNRTTLFTVPAGGGALTPITTLNAENKENSHRWPQFLPDGRHFLFTARSDVIEHTVVYVGSLDSKAITPVFPAQSNASYASGYLLFAREGTLMARRFDAGTLTLSGEAFAVGPRVGHTTPSAAASFGTSLDGRVLAYQVGVTPLSILTWFDRAGMALGTVGKEGDFTEVRLSPDAALATVVIPDRDSGNRDIWLTDLHSGTLTRFTSNPANDWQPVWSPDGRRIAFASDRNGQSSVYLKALDGGDEELLLQVPKRGVFPRDWSKDGSILMLNIDSDAGLPTMAAMRLTGDRTPFPAGPAPESSSESMLTRDARWVTFFMTQGGAYDVYVAPFPRGARRRISIGGGALSQWKADDSELYFAAPDGSVMAAPVRGGSTLEVGTPVRLFRPCGSGLSLAPSPMYMYDVTADGSRFLTICRSPATTPSTVTVSVDWTAALK